MANITIYGRMNSPNTKAAVDKYREKATFIDVSGSAEKMQEMLEHSKGEARVPVIVTHHDEETKEVEVGHEGSS